MPRRAAVLVEPDFIVEPVFIDGAGCVAFGNELQAVAPRIARVEARMVAARMVSSLMRRDPGGKGRKRARAWAALVLAGCSGATSGAPGAISPDEGLTVTREAFRSLAWLVGSWASPRGEEAQMFERYEFVNDTTLRVRTYADASFRRPADSSFVVLRGERVFALWRSAEWVATDLTSGSVRFAPIVNAPNTFTWRKRSGDSREVRSTWRDEKGRVRSQSFVLDRVRR
jgi:hypothetical protein